MYQTRCTDRSDHQSVPLSQTTAINNSEPLILCVDDDEDDRQSVCEVIAELHPTVAIHEVGDGEKALAFLQKVAHEGHLPCLVLLDMNMPRLNGKETLTAIKSDPHLQDLNVVMFTTSSSPRDQLFCEQHGVKMITKPSNAHELQSLIQPLLDECSD
ncbi:MAG: response regulator [Chitinophagaceae bacterium]|nr:MAG: response regulator [Chitinophagaceae bacterium]